MSDNKIVILMFSGGVDSIVCLHELVKQGITPKLFFFQTYKVKKKHVEIVKRNAKRISPNSEFYVFKPRMIDYCGGYSLHDRAEKSYFIHMHEQDSLPEFYPLRYGDKVVLGYVDKEPKGRRKKGELGLAQKEFVHHCVNHNFPFVFPLLNKTTREVDEIFKSLPVEVQKDTLSTTRDYHFGGSYLHG